MIKNKGKLALILGHLAEKQEQAFQLGEQKTSGWNILDTPV